MHGISTLYPDLVPERAALYRRYRSQTFAEVVGQEHVTRTLKNAIANGQVAHAYLLAGARGIGKTSIARIIAKAVNCPKAKDGDPCDACETCVAIRDGRYLDLIEIDAASNRGIDEMRDLREKVRFAPSMGQYKVYVIDEAHQLTNEAFNALLK
ncbi:MAG TPA: AAA family ATPase, partial [Candidatus Limnocylindria bacterium]